MNSSPNLKILFVINGLGRGGSERSLAEMLPDFARSGITPVIATFKRYPNGVEREVLRQGFDVRFISEKGLLSRVRALRRIIKEEQPDIVHTSLFESNLAGRLAAIGNSTAVMSSLVNTPYAAVRLQDPNIKPARMRAVRLIDSWTSRHLTDHFHAVSQAAKNAAIADLKIPANRITVVERGRDANRLGSPDPERRRRARLQLGLSEDAKVLVNVGRHEFQKGQGHLLEAMAQLVGDYPDLTLLIVGREGAASKELERITERAGLQGRVRFPGHRDDVPEILSASDLFVFPSLFEGLPGAVIEALALGLPVVASNIGPLLEVVEEGRNAILVDPASPDKLAAAIRAMLEDQEKACAFGKRSREIFEQRFTLERSASRMIELFQRVAATKAAKTNLPLPSAAGKGLSAEAE